jgi:glycosyltransferase involved in cell wall biosynthesis
LGGLQKDRMLAPSRHELISVVMPVHNALPHLDAAVQSIIGQSHRELEFVIYDDASTDGSTERLRYWAATDDRIRLIEGKTNLGPALSSNKVAAHASGQLIARMDADDISHPQRLARQLELFRARPDVGLVGTLCEIIDGNGRLLRRPELWRLLRRSWFAPFPHGSIMFRRETFEQSGGYRRECEYWEDQDLALRMACLTNIAVIPQALYKHRQSRISTRVASDPERVEKAVDLMYRAMDRLSAEGSYEAILRSPRPSDEGVDPRVFVALGSLELWSGSRPRVLKRLLRRAKLAFNFRSLSALVWAGWAEISPYSLRWFLKLLVEARNSRGTASMRRSAAVDWAPPDKPRADRQPSSSLVNR